ncbi:uncharacterized protein L969DRAFT_95506 [Mixia osmundae IAM 14324]|uniref:RING-type E3 ubiquitin transferase n=1 Tax=Mixia osmundae (strain CBS 9802 / IAM 14324 / JCM 22182 / KY 12970) TaxID=764103 RepID=G7E7L5_MIXOS|nr:uncharacterized protein L969DRAFT_95506 [Mixia osmundae IAM 14324]KEI38427.1 hypothetical protein L969DRAFT_95506 [Mixia osmundae IAM 14324]GAA98825.1 hypothetical protein E5Q_05513 [Mixia osmundae IAM 14324]
MADAQSDADKIRLKRIERLAALAAKAPSDDAAPSSSPTSQNGASKPADPAGTLKRIRPDSQASVRTPAGSAKPTDAPVASTSKLATSEPAIVQRPSESTTVSFPEPFDSWQSAALARILNVTLDIATAEKSNWEIVYLKQLRTELIEEDSRQRDPALYVVAPSEQMTDGDSENGNAERAILARLALDPTDMSDDPEEITVLAGMSQISPFEYLVGAWQRSNEERAKIANGVRGKVFDPTETSKRLHVLERIRQLLISYIGLDLQETSIFVQPDGQDVGDIELFNLMLNKHQSLRLTPGQLTVLLGELAKRFEDDGLEDLIGAVARRLSLNMFQNRKVYSLGNMDAPGAWQQSFAALRLLTSNKTIASTFASLPQFDPDAEPRFMQMTSLLGPFDQISVFPDDAPEVANEFFNNEEAADLEDNETHDGQSGSLRRMLASVQSELFSVYNDLIRSSPKARENVLNHWAHIANQNAKRSAIQQDKMRIASDGVMINLQTVLTQFAEPFMDASYSKMDKIDIEYYLKCRRLDIREETKINATQQEADDYYALADGQPAPGANFISDIFFLSAAYLHLGLMSALSQHKRSIKDYGRFKDHLAELREAAESHRSNAPLYARYQAAIEKLRHQMRGISASQCQLHSPAFLNSQATFCNFMTVWLVRAMDPQHKHPQTAITLPLPTEPPISFKMLPEYLVDDVTEFFTYVSRYRPDVMSQLRLDDLVTFIIVVLSTPYVKNPFLKSKFVEILFYNTRRQTRRDGHDGVLGPIINTHPLALSNLMGALIHTYVEIESTGSHTQFYDKFNTRFYISLIFRVVWHNAEHREALKREAGDTKRFVRFCNLLLNDTTFLLDESLGKFSLIKELDKLMADSAAWSALTEEERKAKSKEKADYEGQAQSYLQLVYESVGLLRVFTEETTAPFVRGEIVDRLAAMLDNNLDVLAGPRCKDLKIANADKIKFRPRELLADILQVIMNLSRRVEFATAVARDGRSYSRELYYRAAGIAVRAALKTEQEMDELRKFVDQVEQIAADDRDDEAGEDVPEEFMDPLTYTIMRDPVLIPKSNNILDRTSISQHLLSEATDPFTRQPLTIEECVPAVDLKSRIDAFLQAKRDARALGHATT